MRVLLLALALVGSAALPASWYEAAREALAAPEPSPRSAPTGSVLVPVTQVLDHFDRRDSRTWTQRAFVNDTYFDGTGPVFLCVGGEGPAMDATVLSDSVHCNDMVEYGRTVGALLVALEHRFYGESFPIEKHLLTRRDYKYLSSAQAVEDLALFHGFVSDTYSLDAAKNKWVSWGGSYPGMLAR